MKSFKKALAASLALAMVVTAVPVASAEAATTAKLSTKSVTVAHGSAKDQYKRIAVTVPTTWKNAKISVSSSNKAVATVKASSVKSGKAAVKVTAVKKGTAKVTVKVTGKKSGKTVKKTLTATAKVVNAGISFTDAPTSVVLGSKVQLKTKSCPTTATVTYTSSDASIATVDQKGEVTPVKAGKVVIQAKNNYGSTAMLTLDVIASNTVKSVEALNGAQLKVTFNEPVVNGVDNDSNIKVAKKDSTPVSCNGKWNDGKTEYVLTVSSGYLDGDYVVKTNVNSGLKNASGSEFAKEEKAVTVKDVVAPTIESTSYDLTGTKLTVVFSEPVIAPSVAVTTRTDNVGMTDTVVVNATNARTASKSVEFTINKTNTSYTDANKNLNIKYTGVTDVRGNAASFDIPAYFDLTSGTQATVVSVKRTSVGKITITFDKAIETAPAVSVNGVDSTVELNNDKLSATATIAAADQKKFSGSVMVSIKNWKAYKYDKIDGQVITTVDLSYTKVAAPVITSLKYVAKTDKDPAYFLATFDKEVTLAAGGTAKVTKTTTEGLVGTDDISFTQTVNTSYPGATKDTAAKITLAPMPTEDGTYTIVLPKDIASSADGEKNVATTFTLNLSGLKTASTVKPKVSGVASIGTSTIAVTFDTQVDIASASNVANYTLVGATVTAAKLTRNTKSSATVELTVSVPNTAVYNLIVSGVKAYNGGEMDVYTSNTMEFKDTVVPVVTKAQITQVGDGSTTETLLTVTFSEAVTIDATAGVLKLTADGKDYALTTDSKITVPTKTVVFTVGDKVKTTAGMLTGVVKADTNSAKIVDSTLVNTIDASTAITVSAN